MSVVGLGLVVVWQFGVIHGQTRAVQEIEVQVRAKNVTEAEAPVPEKKAPLPHLLLPKRGEVKQYDL